MKNFRNNLDFISVIKYLSLFLSFMIFNCLENTVLPYSTALFTTALAQGASLIVTPLLYLSSFLILNEPGLLGSCGICALLFTIICVIYRASKTKMKYEQIIFTLVGLAGFIFLGNTANEIAMERRIFTSILTVIFTFLCMIAGIAVNQKGLKFKLGFEEFMSVACVTSLFGLGISNLVSPFLWKGISILILLTIGYVYRSGICTIISTVLGVSLALYYGQINMVAVFLIWSIAIESLTPLSRQVAGLAVIVTDYLIQAIFSVYPTYAIIDFMPVAIAVFIFCLIPTSILKSIKEKLYSFREKQLVRQTINRNRTMLSGRLYDLSGVFTEMASAFNLFKQNTLTEDAAKNIMEKEIISTACKECDNFIRCKKNEKNISAGLRKIIDIGFAKGKLSLIDLPKELSDSCVHPNNILYGLNRLLAEYRSRMIENANLASGRDLICAETLGIAEILRGLAVESGTLLKYQSRLERRLSDNLFKRGFLISELLIYGENENVSVSMIIAMKEFSLTQLKSVISATLGVDMDLYDKANITEEKYYLSFRKSADYDAVFGIANAKKDGSEISGDTHAVSRIESDKFLVALSDGMGSGKEAESVSSASLSLIESFYKAGLNNNLILNTVNKLLSINTEDCFSALDVTVIDLKTCTADFIKYGSPYGFIINENGIKIVEGNSIPLGIIEELKPSVASTKLESGDMVLLMSDGVSDAFGSSGEVIDFLRTVPAKNPQTLADEILNHAIKLNDGHKKDDMTALAVRVYKKVSV